MSVAEKKSAKKVRLIDAAFELFTNKGINPTAIDEVVKRAGVAKGTFYLYFKDKYDLLDQMIMLKCRELVKNILDEMREETENPSVPPSEKIIMFSDRMMKAFSENRNLAVLVLSDMAAFRRLWAEPIEENEEYRTLLRIFIDGGLSEDEAPKQMYAVFIAASSICCDSVLYQSPYTVEEIRPQVHLMIKSFIR